MLVAGGWSRGRRRIRTVFTIAQTRGGLFVWLIVIAVVLFGGREKFHYRDWLCDLWDWLGVIPQGRESNSTTIRNVGLVLGGWTALVIAVWRSIVADRQARAAQRQADTAQSVLLNDQYQKGAKMLGNDVLLDVRRQPVRRHGSLSH